MTQVLKVKKSVMLDVNKVDDNVSDTKQLVNELTTKKKRGRKPKNAKVTPFPPASSPAS